MLGGSLENKNDRTREIAADEGRGDHMRYEDTSNSVSNSATSEARDDADALATGSNGPATGNVITGAGTLTGLAGADGAPNGHVVEIHGAGGTDTAANGQSMHVDGRFGALVIDEHGSYKYVADGHAPEDFRDLFQYTLVDAKGGRSVADLMITRGAELKVADNAQRVVPGPDGVVTLPAGVDLNDVHVLGRDLIVTLPDGSQIVIVDGAVFVPQLVLGGVEVPSTNLASLLVQSELNTTAGPAQSSGGNFDVPVPPLDPGVPLGDLIPPTELVFTPPEIKEIGQFVDKHPDAGTVSVQLDDDAKAGGNPGGTGDDADSLNATGFLPGSGGDGALTWDLSNGGAPAGFSYIDGPNGSILVQQVQGGNTVTVLTITIDPDTGAYTVVQNAAILHAAADNENNALFTINYTVTDSDGDSAPGTLNINVDDDTPTVSVIAGSDAEVSLTTHDAATIGAGSEAVSTSANFSGVFSGSTSSPGADGAGVGGSSGYALSTTGGASGLLSHGVAINLYNINGVIVGSTATTAAGIDASNTVFNVSTDNNGVVTLTQFSQIDHTADPHPTGAPFTDDIMSLADGAITLTRNVTVVDRDGDSVTGSAAVGIGANLHFVDDGPSIGLADHGEPNLVVDESDLSHNDTQSFAANFSASFGADGPAANSITYALGISAPGADSGLVDVASGLPIVLVLNNGVVEGHVGTAAGALSFTVSVNAAGDVTLDQILAVQHRDGTNPDDSVNLGSDNLVTLTATAHDFDGDTASSTINIGDNLNFHDDGPSIQLSGSEAGLTVDETILGTDDTQAFAGAFSSSFGADGAGTVAYSLNVLSSGANSGLIDSATGQAIVLVDNAGVIEGHVGNAAGALSFTVSVDALGNVTLNQILPLQHPNPLNPDDSVSLSADNLISLTATVTDKDGDSESATLNIGQNLNFEDDGPHANNDSDTIAAGGTTATGNVITGVGTTEGAPNADSAGADQPGHVTAIQGAGGTDTTFSGGVLSIGGTYGSLSIDADGNYTYNRAPGSQGGVDDVFTYTLTDADGDSVTATLTIHIGDATPHTDPNPPVGLDDDALAGGNAGGTGDDPNSVNATGTLSGSGGDGALTFAVDTTGAPAGFTYVSGGAGIVLVQQGGVTVLTVTVGANGSYSVVQNAPIDHVAGSDENNSDFTISYSVTDADGDSAPGTLNISVDDDTPRAFNDTDVTNPATDTAVGNVITGVGTIEGAPNADSPGADSFNAISNLVGFNGSSDSNPSGGFSVSGQYGSLQMDADGNYTYTRAPNTPGGAVDTFTYTYLDGDGDPVSATLTITIADNTPVAGNVNVGLDDDALAGGNAGGTGDDPNSVNASGTLPGSGGDAPLTFGVQLTGAPAGFSYVSGGAGIVLVQQGGVTVLTITVGSNGSYSVVQNAPITHAAGGDENNQAFTINYTVTDSDLDVANGTISISVDDDTPTVSTNLAVQLDDDALAGGNAGGTGDDANATNVTGTLAHSYGADGAGSVAYLTSGAPAGFSYSLQGNGDLWVMQGATHVLTLTVNATTGAYSVSQVAPIDHAAGLDENNVSFTISYNVTDHDGDSATGSIVVNVDDDTPTVSANAAVQLDDDSLAGGNAGGIGDVNPDTANTTGTLAHSYGADGAGSVAYLTSGAPAGFSYVLQPSGDLWVMQGATHVITLTVNSSTGAYTVTQVAQVDHPAGSDENDVAFTISYNVTDHDGDTATGSIVVNVDDDTPTVSANAAVQLDDDALAGGNAGGTGDVNPDTANTTGTLGHSYGADGAGSTAYLTTGAPAGFSYVLQPSGDLWVMQGATHVITLTVNSSTGAYTVTQVAPIDHPAGGNENDVAFTISYQVTDHDGDSATGSIVVNVDDDTPTVSANAAVQLDDDALAGGNAGGIGDVNPDTANTSGTLGHSYGADGAGSMAYLTSGAPAGFSYVLQPSGDLWVMQGATHVITLTVNSSTGAYTVTQVAPINHAAGGDENDASFTISYQVTDHDGDSATGTIVVNVDDDTPTATINLVAGQNVSVDESVGIQSDSNDTTNAGVVSLFAGVLNAGTDTDLPQYATNANAIVTSTGSSFGADGPGTTGFSLNVSSAGVDSGLDTTDGQSIFLFKEGNLVVGRVGGAGGPAAFAIAIDNTGHISTVEYLSINHPDAANADDMVSIANGAVTATVTVTDADGDSVNSTPVGIGSHIQFQDSGPVLSAVDNINIQNTSLDLSATGGFHYALGADGASADNNVFSVLGSATVNGSAVSNYSISETSESATSAVYHFSFDYATGGSSTATETGTLTFDKTNGTYTVDLDNPLQGISVVQTATGTLFQGYEPGGSVLDGSQPAVSVTQVSSNLFVQFTGIAEPSSGTGANNLHTAHYGLAGGSDANPADFANGDLFAQAGSWVSTSNSSNGVAGDTIQGGEVLDFNLYNTNPTGNLGLTPTASADTMFLKFDGIGASEDMIVVLKLYDTVSHTYTTKALMIQNTDIQHGPGAGSGLFSGVTLDQNDGLIVIEPNDYQQGNTHLVIVGAQLAGSDEGITGDAINFNNAMGDAGASIGTQPLSTDVSDGPMKISSIGFITTTTTDQTADLTFNVTVKDGDGDTVTQTIHATITNNVDSATAITPLPASVTTVAPVVLDLNGDGVHFLASDAGVHYDYGSGSVATAWASPQDGILVNDANHNGTVDNASEFVFGSGSVTDLQALAAFDSNGDGQLSSADANFANFAVWQDANSNGVVDAGEMQSLTAEGIASISLSTDGISYTAAGGDVTVAGTGSYTNADGSTGSLADAAFLTGTRTVEQDLRTSSALSTSTALIGALAAAGLAASDALAAASDQAGFSVGGNHGLDTAALQTQAFAPVAVDAVNGDHASNDLLPAASGGAASALAESAASHASDAGAADGLSVGNDAPSSPAPTELLEGTQAPAHDAGAIAPAAASIIMPAAAQLAALASSSVGGAQHDQVVGQVLADALHGGGGEATIDSALASLPGHGGANAALEALASHAGAAVPNGDSAGFAGFTAAHSPFNMEAMVVHADAIQAHA